MADDLSGGALPPPPPSDDQPGWAAPPPPPKSEDEPGWAAPPAAPFPTADGKSGRRRLTPRGGHRRRKASGVGAIAAIALVGARFLINNAEDPSTTFSLPPRDLGTAVEAVPLSSAEVCASLTQADLRRIYERRFQRGQPVGTETSTIGGEPSATAGTPDLGETGLCQWQTKPDDGDPLTITAFTVPAIAGDANGTYELLRPSSPTAGFDATSDIGDEAFFLMDPFNAPPGYNDTMTLRTGGVVMTVNITGDTKPEGGLDLLAEVGQAIVANLAAQGTTPSPTTPAAP